MRSAVYRVLAGLVLLAWVAPVQAAEEPLRDHFVFGARAASGPYHGLALIGVLWDATSPLAMVGDQTLGVGDQVEGWRIVEIRPDGIVVESAGRRETVRIGKNLPPP